MKPKEEKERPIVLGDGWYPIERDRDTGRPFVWNTHRSSFVLGDSRIAGLEFIVQPGPLVPLPITFTFADDAGNTLATNTHRLDGAETAVRLKVPAGAARCTAENDTFVPALITYGSVDIRTLGVRFVDSVTVLRNSARIKVPINEIARATGAREAIATKRERVSVVFPVYGDFSAERLLLSIEAMRAQKDVEPEVVVVERGTTSRLQGKLDPSVIYRFQPYTPSKEFGDFNQGEVRNDAIAASSGEFIYTNDGDVMFMDEHFLARSREILEQNHDMALYRPPMRRLPLDNFEEFKRRADAKSIREAIASLNLHTNEFLATTDDEPRNVRVAVSNSEGDLRVRTTSEEDFARYTADASLKDNEHVIWSENVHYGGNFLRRWQFERVGGYCERYINWGCEDTDFQWKLRNTFNLQHFPKIGKFTVLHLDHEKRYLIPAMVKRNEELFERRRKDGVYLAIKEDRNQKERRGSFHS